jgi:hypothetical protein
MSVDADIVISKGGASWFHMKVVTVAETANAVRANAVRRTSFLTP